MLVMVLIFEQFLMAAISRIVGRSVAIDVSNVEIDETVPPDTASVWACVM